jgi:catechol 2,3-dioxygenase-like lactoylglutathione lyase family enzyme
MRAHISLNVRDVGSSVRFYEKIFAVAPQKRTADYAKFDVLSPPLNLSLVAAPGMVSAVNHFGIEVQSLEEIAAWKARLEQEGLIERVEENVACCYARQDKVWLSDPDGNAWEIFTVHEQLEVTGPVSNTGCCIPKRHSSAAVTSICS